MVKKIIKDKNIPKLKSSVACIGYFDGVHLGHQELIKKTIDEAIRLNLTATLICFEPDPVEVITGKKKKHLLSMDNRLNLIEYFGIEQVIVIKFTDSFMKLSPKEFINEYLNKMNIKELICGFDFKFGYKGKGNAGTLSRNSKFKTIVIPEYKYYGKKISSTRIIYSFINGKFSLTNKLLGYDYYLELIVVDCVLKRNNYIVKTKLKDSNCILPKHGKYGNKFEIKDGYIYITGNSKLNKNQLMILSFN